jgi:hypothetical protein
MRAAGAVGARREQGDAMAASGGSDWVGENLVPSPEFLLYIGRRGTGLDT